MEEFHLENEIKIFIWQPSIDHLHYYTWLALQSLLPSPIKFIVGTSENKIRKAQNWKPLDLQELSPIYLPRKNLLKGGVQLLNENLDAIHVFCGFRGAAGYNLFPLIFHALRKGVKVAVIDEAYATSPVGYFYNENIIYSYMKVWVRPWLRYGMAKVLYAVSHVYKPCILALSMTAKKQFLEVGFAPETIFPFGYFVPKQKKVLTNENKSDSLHLIFVGALIFRKGLDILADAIRSLCKQGYKVELDIYGAGNIEKTKFVDLPIYFKNTLPFDQIQGVIAKHDLLILPSRHDGWGVVVNEALLQGVPVIASSKVGAKQILEFSRAGLIFETENVNDLVEKIKMVIDSPMILYEMKRKASQVGQEIMPENAAQYFLNVLKYYFYKIGRLPSAIWSEESYPE